MIWLAIWTWLKKYWKWLLFPVGIVLYVLGRLAGSRKRPTEVVAPALSEAVKTQQEATSKANSEKAAAKKAMEAEVAQIEAEHADTVAKLTRAQRDEAEKLKEDPEALNQYLLDVGKSLRS